MSMSPKKSILPWVLAAAIWMLGLSTAQAGNLLLFAFGDDRGTPFDTSDDAVIMRPIFWTRELQRSRNWVIARASGIVIPPPGDPLEIQRFDIEDSEIRDALIRAIKAWTGSPYTDLDFDSGNVFFSDGATIPGNPIDVRLDGLNLVSFFMPMEAPIDAADEANYSIFFFERTFDVPTFAQIDVDEIEGRLPEVLIDVDMDGITDFSFAPRTYRRGEIVDADIVLDLELEWRLWPQDPDDIPLADRSKVDGSLDIQATFVHQVGHTIGIAHSWIRVSSMNSPRRPIVGNQFPTKPYAARTLHFDDDLAVGALYGQQFKTGPSGTRGEISGSLFDGVAFDDEVENDAPTTDRFLLQAPVFLGVLAEEGAPKIGISGSRAPHIDNVLGAKTTLGEDPTTSDDGRPIRLIAQVLSGEDITYPIIEGGIDQIEPALGFVLIGDEPSVFSLAEANSTYTFPALPPGDRYVLFTSLDVTGDGEALEINSVQDAILDGTEFEPNSTYPDEFWGRRTGRSSFPDTNIPSEEDMDTGEITGDDPLNAMFIHVAARSKVKNLNIYTNTGNGTFILEGGGIPTPTGTGPPTPTPTPTPTPSPTGVVTPTLPPTPTPGPTGGILTFEPDPDGFPESTFLPLGADMADIDGDGFLDVALASFAGTIDAGGGFNRIYINEPVPGSPGKRRFKDVTFGPDGIPGTPDDVLPPDVEPSRDVKLGDFNGDGRVDLFVSNPANDAAQLDVNNPRSSDGGFNRIYLNLGEEMAPGPFPFNFRFVDVSFTVLPGLLNRGWLDPIDPDPDKVPFVDPPLNADGGMASDNSTGIALGDVDSDGDLDIIISLRQGHSDGRGPSFGPQFIPSHVPQFPPSDPTATVAVIDSFDTPSPTTTGNGVYDPMQDRTTDQYLFFNERILINHQVDDLPDWTTPAFEFAHGSQNPWGFVFLDETLGSDFKFGTGELPFSPFVSQGAEEADASVQPKGGPPEPIIFGKRDRIPPTFPRTRNFTQGGGRQPSPMSRFAFRPIIGSFFQDASLGFVSVRPFQSATTNPAYQSQSAFFQNVDLDFDGIADGYFFCINYGVDFLLDNHGGAGLYPIRGKETFFPPIDPGDPDDPDDDIPGEFELEPLWIGMPDSRPFDVTSMQPETDNYIEITRGAFSGLIGDWEYRGAPQPLMGSDRDFGPMVVYTPNRPMNLVHPDVGALRGQSDGTAGTAVSGNGISYRTRSFFPLIVRAGGPLLRTFNIPDPAGNPRGDPRGMAMADFDLDGDFDFVVAESSVIGFNITGGVFFNDPPSPNRIYLNDGFAQFTEVAENHLRSNTASETFDVLTGDIDNDGDFDIVFIDALTTDALLLNTLYDPIVKPNLRDGDLPPDERDAAMFADQTPRFIPPIFRSSLLPGERVSSFNGITTSIAAPDLNSDGRPDIVIAEGGAFSTGSFPRVMFNVGPVGVDDPLLRSSATKIFKPISANYPGPSINTPSDGTLTRSFNGYFVDGLSRPYYSVVYGPFSRLDLDGNGVPDGYPDLFFTTKGDGPRLYFNTDTNSIRNNSLPDADRLPDGFFISHTGDINPPGGIVDPIPSGTNFVQKKQGRRAAAADFNNDGFLDVCIANGIDGSGAPNVLLFNDLESGGLGLPRVILRDQTESLLPTNVDPTTGIRVGVFDNTYDVAAADFNHDGMIDLIFANQSDSVLPTVTTPGFRYLTNSPDGSGIPGFFREGSGSPFPISGPAFGGSRPRDLIIGDLDGVGEWSEDLNGNGTLDPGEDLNGNGVIDRSEDLNGNGVLDLGEDFNGNGVLDFIDLPDETLVGDINFDGIITKRTNGVWEPSFDVYICFEGRQDVVLLNDPTNQQPGLLADVSVVSLAGIDAFSVPSNGGRIADLDLDGRLDVIIAKGTLSSIERPVQWLLNTGNSSGVPIFIDVSHEFPEPLSTRIQGGGSNNVFGNANDVEVLDVDGDGDLDVYVGLAGSNELSLQAGALDLFYQNRIVKANFRQPMEFTEAIHPAQPFVLQAVPSWSLPGTEIAVRVEGMHFEPGATMLFGDGITVLSVSDKSSRAVTVVISIDERAQPGLRRISVTNPISGMTARTSRGGFRVGVPLDNEIVDSPWRRN